MLCFEHVYVTTRCAVFSSPSALSHRRLAEMYRDSNDGASPACADHARDERTQACQHARVRSSPRVRMYALSDSLKRQEFHDTHVLVDHGYFCVSVIRFTWRLRSTSGDSFPRQYQHKSHSCCQSKSLNWPCN